MLSNVVSKNLFTYTYVYIISCLATFWEHTQKICWKISIESAKKGLEKSSNVLRFQHNISFVLVRHTAPHTRYAPSDGKLNKDSEERAS